ncbi:MAG: hybrid sensor histidine kinase/response regulator [Spirochaetes bacterium]|nr:hybrid sensor histidine kinase/response regulator [Spirochaetota bacterium]
MQTSRDTVLIIDDSKTQLDMVSYYLEELNTIILTAQSGEEGIDIAKKRKPDIILLDINMPKMDGYETCRLLKKDRECSLIPVIFISSLGEMDDIVRGFDAGGIDYIIKPVKKEELLARVRTHLTIKHLQEHLFRTIEEKRLLINILSHDISSHLTVILGSGEIALTQGRERGDHDLEETIEPIIDAAKSINELIEHVRIMDTIDTGKADLELEPIRVEEIISHMLKQYRGQLDAKRLRFICNPPPERISTRILADWISVTNSVFGNLISNAIKFSYPDSTITCSIREDTDRVEIVIKDIGIGMPREILANIVNPAYPTSRPGTEGERGNGFGMPIVNKCMNSYGGSLDVSSVSIEDHATDHGTAVRLVFRKG